MPIAWLATYLLEALFYSSPLLWRFRRAFALLLIFITIVVTSLFIHELGMLFGIPMGILALFRVGNLARILKSRMHSEYLRQSVKRTAWWLLVGHDVALWGFIIPVIVVPAQSLVVMQASLAAVSLILFLITVKNIRKLRFMAPSSFLTDQELPTVTVAIPARNETTDLEECLRSVLANDYPKLEVIVLDDCSRGKTAEIIRSFAHDGVRFIPGLPPEERWLAKNQAYQHLYQEASGELILFCGVDARFGTTAIRSMVNVLASRNKSMLSVLPERDNSTTRAGFLQPMRYWWELSLPRRLFNRPAVLSTCWAIGREDLKKLGGFGAVSHSITPEAYFARELVKTDQYSFIRSCNDLRVFTAKRLSDQWSTTIRTRYPQLRRRPEWILTLLTAEIGFLLLPFVLLVGSIWWQSINMWAMVFTCVVLAITHIHIVMTTNPANGLLSVFNFPIAALSEVIVTFVSMIQYEYFTISWKDRNICIPVMHVYPRLPYEK
ncbi:MAG: glycosyltransferase [Candidatus Saccharimonadales bacterium]